MRRARPDATPPPRPARRLTALTGSADKFPTFEIRGRKLRNPKLPEASFDCVAIMGNSFGYFSNQHDDEKVLASVGRLLRHRRDRDPDPAGAIEEAQECHRAEVEAAAAEEGAGADEAAIRQRLDPHSQLVGQCAVLDPDLAGGVEAPGVARRATFFGQAFPSHSTQSSHSDAGGYWLIRPSG